MSRSLLLIVCAEPPVPAADLVRSTALPPVDGETELLEGEETRIGEETRTGDAERDEQLGLEGRGRDLPDWVA